MDILIQDNKAHELFPEGFPMDTTDWDIELVKDFEGAVEEGWIWDGTNFSEPPEFTPTVTADEWRSVRDVKLEETDWVVTKHLELGLPIPEAWLTYRQGLRDITSQPQFPDFVNWPEKPE
jgi:hypothetical protein